MAAEDVLKNFNLFVDGRGFAGNVEGFTPPALTLVTEDFRGGGMDAPVALDMGMEAMESSFSLISYDRDVLALFGVAEGNAFNATARGALESYDGTVTPVVHALRGKITKVEEDEWKPGEKMSLKITMRLDYYRKDHGGQTVHEIDILNGVRTINGTDRMADIRAALGL